MRSFSTLILILFLSVLLHSQTNTLGSTYTVNGATYSYIIGSGTNNASTLGPRNTTTSDSVFTATTGATPTSTGPAPATINCPINQVYDNILCQCVCIVGYYFSNGTCYPNINQNPTCGQNQVYQDHQCECASGFYLIGTICTVCPPYSTYNINTLSCVCVTGYVLVNGQCSLVYNPPTPPTPTPTPQCSLNQQLVNNICTCLPNFYLVKGVCTYCVAPNFYDTQLAVCRPNCTTNMQLDLNTLTCICLSGFFNIQGTCGTCYAYSVYSTATSSCQCIQGYIFNSGICIPSTTPPTPPSTLPVPPSPCSDNHAVLVAGQCVCMTNYHLIGGVCQQCPSSQFFDPNLQICRIQCNVNAVFNITTGVCNCAPNYFIINGTCTKCPGNSTYNSVSLSCVCPNGYNQAIGGFCVIGCGVNEVLSNGQCCCITNFYPVNGICGQCAWNQVYDQGLGICRVPCSSKTIYDISTQSCVCLPQYYQLSDGTCGTCPLYSTYSSVTQTCICNAGYILNLGLCTSACNTYETWVNGTCICKQGYYLIGYSCGICPPQQTYDTTYRICHSPCQVNEVWDPTIRACRCLPAYYLIGGMCSQCNTTTQVYNQASQCCDCISGYQKASGQGCNGVCSPICTVNQDWISNRCVCKPGFNLINNFCTQCPAGQIYDQYNLVCRIQCGTNQVYSFDSGLCVCAQNYYLVQGICSQCPSGETYDNYTMTCSIVPCQQLNQYYSPITQTCLCLPQYILIRGVCTNCNPGYYYDSYSDQCLCKPGYVESNGFCNPVCPSDQSYVNGNCQCNNGQPITKGICTPPIVCPLYSYFYNATKCCVCNPGYSVINGACSSYQYCGQNGYLQYGQCYCNSGYFWILGTCRPCGQNEGYNGVACACYLGYTRDVNGNCVQSNFQPTCFSNERYDTTLKACVCVQGTQYIRGQCVTVPTCPANAYFNGIACVCNTGLILSNSQCVTTNVTIPSCPANSFFNGVSCTCNIGFYQQTANSCGTCAQGTTFNGQACVTPTNQTCASGYIFNTFSNQCQPSAPSCGAYAYFNGATCVCVTGYSLISGVCQICPSGTVFDGAECSSTTVVQPTQTCGSNQLLVNGACVCNNGMYMINGQCLSCPSYTTWNGQFCQCGCQTAAWCMGIPFSSYNALTNQCSCQSGYILVNGFCTASTSS